jgi:5-methylcytosine-specific restriction endonuclease McrA
MRVLDESALNAARGRQVCYGCGKYTDVAPHHLIRRSELRLDIPENLIPLCWACHRAAHDHPAFEASLVARCRSRAELETLARFHRSKRLLAWLDAAR